MLFVGMVCWSAGSCYCTPALQPSTDHSVRSKLLLSSPSTVEAAVGPASFTQVRVAWHHDNPLVTASDPLQRRCRAVSPSLAARLSPRVGGIAIILCNHLSRVVKTVSASVSPRMIMAGALQHAVPIQGDAYYMPIPTVDPGSLQCSHAASRSHSSINNISQPALQYQISTKREAHGYLA